MTQSLQSRRRSAAIPVCRGHQQWKSTICSPLIWPNFWVQSIPLRFGQTFQYNLFPSDMATLLSTIYPIWYDHTLDAWITIDKKRVWQDYKSEIFLLGCFFSAQLIVVKDCKTRALTYSFCLHMCGYWLVWSMINGTKLSGELCEQCQVAWSRTLLCELRE